MLSICLSLLSCNKSVEILPNQIGILVNESGVIDTTKVLHLGNYILKSSQEIVFFDISNQSNEFEIINISKDKKEITIVFTMFFRPISSKTPILYKEYEKNYIEELLIPNTEKIVNQELKNYDEIELSSKEKVNKIIFNTLKEKGNYNTLIEVLDINTTKLSIGD